MMKIIVGASAILLSTALISAEEKICFVNFEAALTMEKKAKSALDALDAAENAIVQDEQKAREGIEKKMMGFRATAATLSEKARQEKEMELTKEIESLQQKFTQRRTEQAQKRQEVSRQLEDENRLLLNNIAKNENCKVVLNAAALVYVSDDTKKNDLTQKLSDGYNKAYQVKPEAKTPASNSKAPAKAPAKK